jgi:hypothetical protein
MQQIRIITIIIPAIPPDAIITVLRVNGTPPILNSSTSIQGPSGTAYPSQLVLFEVVFVGTIITSSFF